MAEKITLSGSISGAQVAATLVHRIPVDVTLEASPEDGMLRGIPHEHYLSVGIGALTAIQSFARMWGVEAFGSIMDFGCGHGRVLRWLRAAYPLAAVVGADIDADGVAFCARTFGAEPLASRVDFGAMQPPRNFDLIFAGSVITHLSEDQGRLLLEKFISWLNPGGIAVLSSHGNISVARVLQGVITYGLADNVTGALSGYFERGYGYADFPASRGYGTSFIRPDWFSRFAAQYPGRLEYAIVERGWDNHHDMIGFRRT